MDLVFLRTTSAHIDGDQNNWPQYARDLNTHQALYRNYYIEKISADFPLTVTIIVKGEVKVFENPNDYFDWLLEATKATVIWRGCVDVMAISNLANMEIDIVVHEDGIKPLMNHFKPDPSFPWMEEDPMKPTNVNEKIQGKMLVLNWKNTHFNLIVGKDHMLSQYGSLSFQAGRQKFQAGGGEGQPAGGERQGSQPTGEDGQRGPPGGKMSSVL